MIYRATIRNREDIQTTSYLIVKAETVPEALAKISHEYPNHNVASITEDIAIDII